MSRILDALARHAAITPRALALRDAEGSLDYAGLQGAVHALAEQLASLRPRVIGLLSDNGIDWAVADLAALAAGIPCVPLPTFFTPAQRAHVLASAGVDLLLADAAAVHGQIPGAAARPLRGRLSAIPLANPAVALPPGTVKITFTSGTTGTPKGVCLSLAAIEEVAESLRGASQADASDRHLALLPLATLLENIAGLYVPLLARAVTHLLPGARVGLRGSSELDPFAMLAALGETRATTAILVPQLLHALVAGLRAGASKPAALRYLALGGAHVSPRLLAAAAALGLPVFEGYGLSECASVVAVNGPGDKRPGSVGHPLPHLELRIDEQGGIQVRGAAFLGYLGEAPRAPEAWVETGDLGHFDGTGRLHVTGRRKNVFITAYGRNVAPEWVESELLLQPAVAQAAVFGEARPFSVAVLLPRGEASDAALTAAVAAANRELPDYARIGTWIRAEAPFSPANGQLTTNGRLRRAAIAKVYATAIENCYRKETDGLLY